MFDPLDEDKKGNYDPWWFTVNITEPIYNYIFYENDTNKVTGTYRDDCFEKKKKKKRKTPKNIFCILNWGIAVSCSRNMNFVKFQVSETSEEKKISMIDIFCFFMQFCIGAFFADQVELTKHIPLYSYFSCSDPPLTQQYFFLTLPWKYAPTHTY